METESLIRLALEKLMKGRTSFIIAHRIQSVMSADLILVLDKGRIVQQGTHAELVQIDGIYKQVFELQTQLEVELKQEINASKQEKNPGND
jgi:ATP-binding cassette, subfamily B, bacterial